MWPKSNVDPLAEFVVKLLGFTFMAIWALMKGAHARLKRLRNSRPKRGLIEQQLEYYKHENALLEEALKEKGYR